MEGIEKSLTELESFSAKTEARIQAIPRHGSPFRRCLVLVNEPDQLDRALQWIKSHWIDLDSILLIQKFGELTSPIVLKPEEDQNIIIPTFLVSTINSITSASIPSSIIYAVPSLELTTTAVNLLHSGIDLVLVVGCHCLSRKEYEDVNDFKPFVEEILLKEAIQPIILFK